MTLVQKITTGWTQEESLVQAVAPNKVLNIGVIGYGYWGPKLVRNFQELANTRVTMVADLDGKRLEELHKAHPTVEVTNDYHQLLASDVDAVVIATPVTTHHPIARECLLHGKHVLIEKPFAHSSEAAQ